jgi:hypothetical protein
MKSEAIKTTTRKKIPSLPGYTPDLESTGKEAASVDNSLEINGKLIGRNG